jgi:L-ribulose-5-phosphate 3-epimerase
MEGAVSGKHPIGIIQGRLTPSGGRLQCFPHGKWREEFSVAKDAGFDCIELIVERKLGEPNPIWEPDGVQGLLQAMRASGVQAFSLCDDQIMDAGLLKADGSEVDACFAAVAKLIGQMGKIGATRLILPFLEQASLKGDRDAFLAVRAHLEKLVPIAEVTGIALLLEDDLPVPMLKELVSTTAGKIGVCYDTGNRAYLGYEPSEILEFGGLIRHVHIKDKEPDGKNIMLGKGKVDFKAVFANLKTIGYEGPFILETSRGDEEVQSGRENLAFVNGFLQD